MSEESRNDAEKSAEDTAAIDLPEGAHQADTTDDGEQDNGEDGN